MKNLSDIKSLYKFAAESSFPGVDSQDQGIIFRAIHDLLTLDCLDIEFNAKYAPVELNIRKSNGVEEFASRIADRYGFNLRHYPILHTPVPSESQFIATSLPFDDISKQWTMLVAEVSFSLIFVIQQKFADSEFSNGEDSFLAKETSSMGLEDMLTEIIITTAQMFAWAGLGHDYKYNLQLLEQAITTIDNPTLNNPVSVYSAMANTGFGLLVPLINRGYLASDIFVYKENGEITLNAGIRNMLIEWKQEGSKRRRYTGGCLWRFREYTKQDGTKYSLEYSMIDMAALTMLKFLNMHPLNQDEA